jgi:5-methyltetrahydrofolate--homocysteine methyltransferase
VTETLIGSASREVVIGPERPFVVIGERINPTGRRLLASELQAGDLSRIASDAEAQLAAGAQVLDVNVGVPLADEPALMAAAVERLQALSDAPLAIDSSVIGALQAGLEAYRGKALLNSVTGEEERLEQVLPLVRRHGAAVVAICNDDSGIAEDIDLRYAVAKKIVERAADHGIPREDVVVDPLVMPVGAVAGAGRQVFRLIRRLREELQVNTVCGASNISFGLPNRAGLNPAFLSMAIAAGLTSAIANPLEAGVMAAVRAADLLLGRDEQCAGWIGAYREQASGRPGRRRRRRRPPSS